MLKKYTIFATTLLLISTNALNAKETSVKMKMTTDIPESIITPDEVNSRLGTLHFKNGMPDKKTIEKVYENIDFSRAVETYLNTIPAVSMYTLRKGQRDADSPDNTAMTMETLMDSKGMYLTPNTVTPQTWLTISLKNGPMVLETPPNIIGLVDDMWFRYIADLGMLGKDKNKGGKYLFLPPNYKGEIPKGYFVFKSPTYSIWAPWRNIAENGDIKPALENIKKYMRLYPLSEADKPHKELVNINGSFKDINTISPNNFLFWEYW